MRFWLLIFFLLVGNIFGWWQAPRIVRSETALYFLDIGQGDSQLIQLDDIQILIDGGPDASVLKNLEKIMAPTDRYIDLVILSHPQLDHFGGLIDILERYEIGKFVHNGREGTTKAYRELAEKLNEKNSLILKEGDSIKYKDYVIKILSPSSENLKSKELNDTTIVTLLEGPDWEVLYTGDIGFNIEDQIRKKYNIQSDVLKVGHHGSRFSSGEKFLKEVKAKIAIIEVGKNSYGHPNPAALQRLEKAGAQVYTTLRDGIIKIIPQNNQLKIFKEK